MLAPALSPQRLERYRELGRAAAAAYPNAEIAFISGSLIEGFGNDASDLDVFVLGDDPGPSATGTASLSVEQGGVLVEIDYLEDVRTDTEVWPLDQVHRAERSIAACDPADQAQMLSLSQSFLDFAHRVLIGVPVLGEPEFRRIQGLFSPRRIAAILCQRLLGDYNEYAEDAAGAIRAGAPVTSVLNSRAALGAAVDALLAAEGETNGKAKWREYKLARLGDDGLARRYREAEIDAAFDDESLLANSRSRLRLAGELAAQAAGRLDGLARCR